MTQDERMAKGYLWYDTGAYFEEQARAKDLMYEFNHSRPSEEDKRRALLPQIFGEIGEHCIIQQPITLMRGKTVHIGDYCYFNSNTFFVDDYDIYLLRRAGFTSVEILKSWGATSTLLTRRGKTETDDKGESI